MSRSRKLHIVELENGNWHTITRIKAEAESVLKDWNEDKDLGGATLISFDVPEAETTKPELYQCPYEKACKCSLEDPCKGCETWAAHYVAQALR